MATYSVSGAGVTVTVTYSVTDSATSYTVKITKVAWNAAAVVMGNWEGSSDVLFSGTSTAGAGSLNTNVSRTVTKTHSAQSIVLDIAVFNVKTSTPAGPLKHTFSISAKTSYAVSYNANGGTLPTIADSYKKKWYNETLKLYGAISRAASSPGNYTVTLNGNGASNPSALTSKRTITYAFRSWGTTSSGGTTYAAGANYTGNAALNLYALWNSSESRAAVTLPTPARAGWKLLGWATSSGGAVAYQGGASYTPTGNVTLYAIWQRNIDSVTIGEMDPIRVASSTGTAEEDEGTYALLNVPVAVKGAASADITLTAKLKDQDGLPCDQIILQSGQTYDAESHVLTQVLSGEDGKPETEADFSPTFTLRASGLDTDKTYYFEIDASAANTSVTQDAVPAPSRTAVLATAFFTMDVRAGGHGVSFGAPARSDGFNVSMPIKYYEHRMLPYLVFDTLAWTEGNLAQCKAAVADYRPCTARFSNGAMVEFDDDPATDVYN